MDIILESANTPSQELHLLPCEIDHNGPAKVSSYFVHIPSADPATGKPCSTATFRGRQLYGTKNQLPTKYTGHVYSQRLDHDMDESDETEVTHECIETFKDFTVWKHDSAPEESTDAFFTGMGWAGIAGYVSW
ncbi:hypothetical protein NQZ79_g4396 [Umbelopsis isabellina]|nr:hypothetical protein NQZ79_g4396 [Umbelopsis isabellina]